MPRYATFITHFGGGRGGNLILNLTLVLGYGDHYPSCYAILNDATSSILVIGSELFSNPTAYMPLVAAFNAA